MAFSLKRGQAKVATPDDGSMTLVEHLRELRTRIVKAIIAIAIGAIIAWIFYDHIFHFLTRPYYDSVRSLAAKHKLNAELTLTGPTEPFTLKIKATFVAGVVFASPVWLYQIWAFIVPGLKRRERRWSLSFVGIATPLFLGGIAIGYYILPTGMAVLLSFTPAHVANLVNLSDYLNFVLRMLLVFGAAFEIPLFVVLLNLAGVVKGAQLGRARPWIIVAVFAFAAIATPSTDPISMLFLAIPMTILFLISEVIARVVDKRRGVSDEGDYEAWDDEEVSALSISHAAEDERASDIDDTDLDED